VEKLTNPANPSQFQSELSGPNNRNSIYISGSIHVLLYTLSLNLLNIYQSKNMLYQEQHKITKHTVYTQNTLLPLLQFVMG